MTTDEFFRFPSTPHLVWLASGQPRDDKLLAPDDVDELLGGPVVVEEKVDGANIGISFDASGQLRLQNRGEFIKEGAHPQFSPLWSWAYRRIDPLRRLLGDTRILFGEWCYAAHTIEYTQLPDWFFAFDLYSKSEGEFFSVRGRNEVLEPLDVEIVREVARGQFDTDELVELIGDSEYTDGPMEGIVVRGTETGRWAGLRGKIVRAEFIEEIDEHWKSKQMRVNELSTGG